jgi:hypothetical protein
LNASPARDRSSYLGQTCQLVVEKTADLVDLGISGQAERRVARDETVADQHESMRKTSRKGAEAQRKKGRTGYWTSAILPSISLRLCAFA